VVPAGLLGHNIIVFPLLSGKIVRNDFFVLGLRVPAAIGKQLAVTDEDGVATSAHGNRHVDALLVVALPGLSLDIETPDVIKRMALVAQATMTTIDEDFAFRVAIAAVGARRWSTNC
jgi:hypothetical protein